VEFEDKLSARTAVERYNMTEFMSRIIHVRLDRTTADVEESNTFKVFVGNIPWNIHSSELAQHFRDFPSMGIQLMTNMSGRSRGFALIEYATKEEAERCINGMHMTLIGDREIQVASSQSLLLPRLQLMLCLVSSRSWSWTRK
jgi:RNA recognition motif-containing protein